MSVEKSMSDEELDIAYKKIGNYILIHPKP